MKQRYAFLTWFLGAFFFLLLVSPAALAVDPSPAAQQNELSDSDLHRLEGELEDPSKRLQAIAALARFAQWQLYQVGSVTIIDLDPKRYARLKTAAELAKRHSDVETVSQALSSADPDLQMWGLWFWNAEAYNPQIKAGRHRLGFPSTGLTKDETRWRDLLPKIRELARNSVHSGFAIQCLASWAPAENRAYLRSLIPRAKSPSDVLTILENTTQKTYDKIAEHPDYRERDRIYSTEILRRLNESEFKVRIAALQVIDWNPSTADMWRVRFSPEVITRVNELITSADAEEQKAAKWAAEALPKIEAWCNAHGR